MWLFPTLAVFCFRLWRCFVSDFGGVLFPILAEFYFRLWRCFVGLKPLGDSNVEIQRAIEQRNGFGISLDIGLTVIVAKA